MRRLELGSGYAPTPGFVHLDVNPAAPIEVCASATSLPIASGSVAELRAVDVLEHLAYRATAAVLAEWARVLAPGGVLFVQVPDAGHIMADYATATGESVQRWPGESDGARAHLTRGLPPELPATPLAGAMWRLMGGQEDEVYVKGGDRFGWNLHRALFDADALRDALYDAGFSVERCETNAHPNLQCWARK